MPAKRILPRATLCAVITAMFLVFSPLALAKGPAITPQEALSMIQSDKGFVILDVRNPDELKNGYYQGSINIPVKELEKRAAELPAGKTVLIHCAKGVRAKNARTSKKSCL